MLPSRGVFAVHGPFGNAPRQFTAIAERSRMHQDDILPWLNAREHISATSCQESGPLHKPARKDEEHGGQPAPFALVDQHEPSRKLPGMRLSGRATAAWAQDAKRVRTPRFAYRGRTPGFARQGSRAGAARRGSHAGVRTPGGGVCQGQRVGGRTPGQRVGGRVPGFACRGQRVGGRTPGFARRGSPASLLDAQNRWAQKNAAPKSGAFPANYGRKPDPP